MITVTPGQARILQAIEAGANTRQKVRAALKVYTSPRAAIRALINAGLVCESGQEAYILHTGGQKLQRTRPTLALTGQPYQVATKKRQANQQNQGGVQ